VGGGGVDFEIYFNYYFIKPVHFFKCKQINLKVVK